MREKVILDFEEVGTTGEVNYRKISRHGRAVFVDIGEAYLRSRAVSGVLPDEVRVESVEGYLRIDALPPTKMRINAEIARREHEETPKERMMRRAIVELNKIIPPRFEGLPEERIVNTNRLAQERAQRVIYDLDSVEGEDGHD